MLQGLRSYSLLLAFAVLASITSNLMWFNFQWRMIPHLFLILLVAMIGENLVSSQGYYYYTKQVFNGPFLRNMPIWIMFLWVFCVQSSLLIPLALGLNVVTAIVLSGFLALLGDFLLFEPFLSRRKQLWLWTSVENGYFEFIPQQLDRFTAPPGNYVTWLVFPILANSFLALFMLLF